MNKHTPGPWTATESQSTKHMSSVHDDRVGLMLALVGASNTDEQNANARLIAAAPELYEALRYMVDNPEFDPEQADILARAALAKVQP